MSTLSNVFITNQGNQTTCNKAYCIGLDGDCIGMEWNIVYRLLYIICCWFYNIVAVAVTVVALSYNFSCREKREKSLFACKNKKKKEEKKHCSCFVFGFFFS